MITPWRFRFIKLDSPEEGERINRATGKKKADYIGQVCRQVTLSAPYGMEFIDGAIWALDPDQLELVNDDGPYQSHGPSTEKYRRPVKCIETGEVFSSQSEAARWVGVTRQAINQAVYMCGTAGGYHFEWVEGMEE